MLVIDVSESMTATDVAPSRIEAARAAGKHFADLLTPGINLGLVKFSSGATLLVAPTRDRDQVKQAIDGLRGTIEVHSVLGQVTVITLKIPLTLAIIESLLVQIGKDRFVLPLSLVDECILLSREDIDKSHGRDILQVRESMVPYVPLRRMFRMEGPAPAIQQVVICQIQGKRIGFVVDWVIGEHQTVIKSLGRMYQRVEGVSGATILGDGSVALILDIQAIIQAAELDALTAL